jgi:hypothetical protein
MPEGAPRRPAARLSLFEMVHTNEITPFSNAAGKHRNLPAPLSSAAGMKSALAKTASAAMQHPETGTAPGYTEDPQANTCGSFQKYSIPFVENFENVVEGILLRLLRLGHVLLLERYRSRSGLETGCWARAILWQTPGALSKPVAMTVKAISSSSVSSKVAPRW